MTERSFASVDGLPGAGSTRAGMTAGVTIALAVVVLALPSAILGFGTKFEAPRDEADAPHASDAVPAEGTGARLARALSLSFFGRAPIYPFTAAKNPERPDRSVTVAVLDAKSLKTITVPGTQAERPATPPDLPLPIAQTGFNLGVARGYRNFAQDLPPAPSVRRIDGADVSRYSLAPRGPADAPRYGARAPIDDHSDAGSSYRVLRNLNLTAGLRSLQDRDRVKPLNDANPDNQAVYVGTQFKF